MDIDRILKQVDRLFEENRGEEAEQLMQEAIVMAVREQDDESLLAFLNELMGYYRETSQVENSYAMAAQAISLAQRMGLEGTVPYATTLLNVANAYRAGGRLEDSLNCYLEVRRIYEHTLSPDSMLMASLENNLSLLYQEMGDFAEAKECLLRALPIVKAKQADFEVAVTYANLAGTCTGLNETAEAGAYAMEAIKVFEAIGVQDAHYGAALSALGTYYYQQGKYKTAMEVFERAMEIMEANLGKNEYYYRLRDNIEACKSVLERQKKAQVKHTIPAQKGLELCRKYYETYGKPMIENLFTDYADKIAVGLVGEGSDCFGYDDEWSRDHDWGPGFCLWVTEETYAQIGEALKAAYDKLPDEFMGYRRTVSDRGRNRRGVMTIPAFYHKLLLASDWQSIDWQQVSDAALAAAVNGEVFRDDEGIFTAFRMKLLEGYPENIRYLKLADSAARFAQSMQYNYERMLKRGDFFTAAILLSDGMKEAMKLQHYIEGRYPLHDKWLCRSLKETENGQVLAAMLEELQTLAGQWEQTGLYMSESGAVQAPVFSQIELIGKFLVSEMYAESLISDTETYLDAHTDELLHKSVFAARDNEALVEKIAELEFEAFDKVKNEGGRADCQNDWATFSIMRKSQYLTWKRPMLLQYLYDFDREYHRGHNLIEEKYGRMMESTAPEEYAAIRQYFPELSPEKKAVIEQIVEIQVAWMEEFAAKYPCLADNARSVRSAEDNRFNTSYETYLRGEISTYSDKMLELYGRYVVEFAAENRNLAFEIMGNSVRLYGYKNLDEAERFLER